jgi:hypothetical protein
MAENVGHPHRPDRAKAAVTDEAQQPREFGLIGIVVAGHAHDARSGRTVTQPLAACGVGDRLLDQDMLSRIDCLHRNRLVRMGWTEDEDRVRVNAVEHFRDAGEGRDPPLTRSPPSQRYIGVAERYKACVASASDRRLMQLRHDTGARKGDPQFR